MATDIAFVVGCLALLGSRVPRSLRILLLALAIVDDIGAILVIAIGYTESLEGRFVALAVVAIAIVHLLSRVGVRQCPPYIAVGAVAWIALHESGIHATLNGVIVGLMTLAKAVLVPERFREFLHGKKEEFHQQLGDGREHRAEVVQQVQRLTRETVSPLEYLEMTLHPWTAYFIMPVLALANAGVAIELSNLSDQRGSRHRLALVDATTKQSLVTILARSSHHFGSAS